MKNQIVLLFFINILLFSALNVFCGNTTSINGTKYFDANYLLIENQYSPSISSIQSIGERKLIVVVRDESYSQQSEATVIVYSLDGQDELGPYNVVEGIPLIVDIDSREWSVRVIEKTPISEVTWHIE